MRAEKRFGKMADDSCGEEEAHWAQPGHHSYYLRRGDALSSHL